MDGHAIVADEGHSAGVGSGDRRSGPLGPAIFAGTCLVALGLVWAAVQLIPSADAKDISLLREFAQLNSQRVESIATFVLGLLAPGLFVAWAAAILAGAALRRQGRLVIALATTMSLAPATCEVLKSVLRHNGKVSPLLPDRNSWPSGHAAAALILVLCAALASPARLRVPIGAIGAVFALATGGSLLILARHLPSDVLGGYLVAAFWFAVAVATLRTPTGEARTRAAGRTATPSPSAGSQVSSAPNAHRRAGLGDQSGLDSGTPAAESSRAAVLAPHIGCRSGR